MKRLIAVLSLAMVTPVLAQQPFGPTDPIMPACVTDAVMAAAGGTVVSADHTRAQGDSQDVERHVELDGDYFDPGA